MGTTTATHGLGIPARNPKPIVIEENSLLMKALSCVPLIGIIPSIIQENSLANKLYNTAEVLRLIELTNVKNQYKIANVINYLLTAALIVAGIAFGIFNGPFAFGIIDSPLLSGTISIILLTGAAGLNVYKILQNNAVINELKSTGFRFGMRIV